MKNNTIIWCTDGSYHRKPAPKVSGAGLMAYCTKTSNNTTGSFYEISEDAGSYSVRIDSDFNISRFSDVPDSWIYA